MTKEPDLPEIHVRRENDVLVPASEFDMEMLRRHPQHVLLRIRLHEARSVPLNRLYWAVLRAVVEGTGEWAAPEAMHEDMKDALGYRGKSTGFEAMSAERFREYSRFAFERIREVLLPDMSVDEILDMGRKTLSPREQEELTDPGEPG